MDMEMRYIHQLSDSTDLVESWFGRPLLMCSVHKERVATHFDDPILECDECFRNNVTREHIQGDIADTSTQRSEE